LVQDVEALELRMAMARNQGVRIEGDGLWALVHHLVTYGKHVFVVDRDGAAEFESLPVVVDEGYRLAEPECHATLLLPSRLAVRQWHVVAGGGDPAEFTVEGQRRTRRFKQNDRRRFRIDRLAVLREQKIVDARALEIDRSGKAGCLDLDTRR